MNPVRSTKCLRIGTEIADHLQTNRQAIVCSGNRNRYTRRSQERPHSIEYRISGCIETFGSSARRARREKHVAVGKHFAQRTSTISCQRLGGLIPVMCDGQPLCQQALQTRAD